MTDAQEYWAEGAQCWFDCSNPGNSGGAANRYMLKAKDPTLAGLLTEVYGDVPWRYTKIADRKDPADLAHLAGFDRMKMPIFNFANSPRIRAEREMVAAKAAAVREMPKGKREKQRPIPTPNRLKKRPPRHHRPVTSQVANSRQLPVTFWQK